MILIVDMNWKKDSLGFYEFVQPIVSIAEEFGTYTVKHFSDLTQKDIGDYSKVILSGTALKDHATLNQIDKLQWIKNCDVPVLGICAGMQTLSVVFGASLNSCLRIGMLDVETTKENPLFSGTFKAYALHNYSVEPSEEFEILAKSERCVQAIKHKQKTVYGVLFHPEVRNQDILRRFILS